MKSIAILSVPRSGSTWLGQILATAPDVVYRFQPNFAYTFPSRLFPGDDVAKYDQFLEQLLSTKDPFVRGELSISGKYSRVIEPNKVTSIVWKEVHFLNLAEVLVNYPNTTVIGLVRSPLAVISSWLNTPNEFSEEWNPEEEWMDGRAKNIQFDGSHFGYSEWKKITKLFLRLSIHAPNRFVLCSYEELVRNRSMYAKEIFLRSGLKFTNSTDSIFKIRSSSVDQDPYSTNKAVFRDNKWRNELPTSIYNSIIKDPFFKEMQLLFGWEV